MLLLVVPLHVLLSHVWQGHGHGVAYQLVMVWCINPFMFFCVFQSCPVVALDLLLNKLPADAAGLFIKPNPAYEVSGKWYCNQKVGEHSLKNRVSSMFDTEEESFTSHSMKRTGATGVADFPDAFRQSMGGWADPGSMKSYTVHGTAKRGLATAAMMAAITPSDVAVNSSNATHVSASTVVAAHVGGGVEVSSTPAALPSPLPLSSPSSPAVATVPAPPPPPSPPSPPCPPMALPTSSPACGLSFTGQGIVHGASPLLSHAGAQSVVVPSAAQPCAASGSSSSVFMVPYPPQVYGMPGGPQPFLVQSVAQPSMGYVGHHLEAQMQSMQGSFAMMQSMQMQQMHQLQQASIERMMKRMKRMERKMSP
ncbi:hypothetical protein [Bosea sp. (in: a-proteobacteria)]|uniref:hypothetical protein n=1 Tax=Bosea sp. (in: a-proteobacteria) TaxID=1871050 RepID=UPI004033853E